MIVPVVPPFFTSLTTLIIAILVSSNGVILNSKRCTAVVKFTQKRSFAPVESITSTFARITLLADKPSTKGLVMLAAVPWNTFDASK